MANWDINDYTIKANAANDNLEIVARTNGDVKESASMTANTVRVAFDDDHIKLTTGSHGEELDDTVVVTKSGNTITEDTDGNIFDNSATWEFDNTENIIGFRVINEDSQIEVGKKPA